MGEDSYLDASYEDRHRLAKHDEPPYEGGGRSDPDEWDEDGIPHAVADLSDDGDALASAGWGTAEDYGGYWDE